MAINPETHYPGKITPSTADYPYGSARNITTPGDGTGTPWDSALLNDVFGFEQALLAGAGIVPSGTPEKITASQYFDSLFNLTDLVFANVADLVAGTAIKGGSVDLTRLIGSKVSWVGYTTPLDGGGNWGTVKTGAHTADGGSIFSIDASTYVEADHSDVVLMRRFGANGTGDLAKLQAALDFAAGKPVDINGCANLSGTITGVALANMFNSSIAQVTLAGLLTFDPTNADLYWQDIHFDGTAVPNGTSTAVYVNVAGHFESVNSDVRNAPRGNLLVGLVDTVVGWGGDFSNAGQENFVNAGVNIGTGLHLNGIKTRGRWYNPIADDCWQIGVFITGDVGSVCRDTVVYNAAVKDAADNGVRVQPSDLTYTGTEDCGFVNPNVDGCLIDNIRINGIRSFCDGGISTNATGWACKSDGGTDLIMKDIYARGNGGGIGCRVERDLHKLTVSGCDTDIPPANTALYVVQVDGSKDVHDVLFKNNTTNASGGNQADLAIILVTAATGERLSAVGNTYKGVSSASYREVFGRADKVKSVGNGTTDGGAVRAYTNLSNCTGATVLNFSGMDDSGTVLWGIEANNGTVNSRVGKSAFLDRTSTLVGGVDSAQVTDIGGNI